VTFELCNERADQRRGNTLSSPSRGRCDLLHLGMWKDSAVVNVARKLPVRGQRYQASAVYRFAKRILGPEAQCFLFRIRQRGDGRQQPDQLISLDDGR